MGTMKLICLFLLLVPVVAAPHSSAFPERSDDWVQAYDSPEFGFFGGDTAAATAEDSRRLLFQYGLRYKYPRNKYLSYYAIKENNIPCGRRGSSYYDCSKRKAINPYRRACIAITGCARFTDS